MHRAAVGLDADLLLFVAEVDPVQD